MLGAVEQLEFNWLPLGLQAGLILLLLAFSAAVSCGEAALFSLLPAQAGRPDRPPMRFAGAALRSPRSTLRVVLLAQTLTRVLIAALTIICLLELAPRLSGWVVPAGAALVIGLIIALGEIAPRIVGAAQAERLARPAALLIGAIGLIGLPLVRALDALLVRPLSRLLLGRRPAADDDQSRTLTADELKVLLEMSRRGGVIEHMEDAYLREVIDLREIRARDVMIPRVEVAVFDIHGSPDELRKKMRASRHTKVPVFDGSIDNIVGLVYTKILFFETGRRLRDIVQPVRFVPELISGEQLLDHFRRTRSQIAVAVDEFGGMAGLVTLEDVIERIVGDIHDPEDRQAAPEVRETAPGEFEVAGRLSVRHWTQMFGRDELPERVATLSGLITALLGRPARPGQSVRLGNLTLIVIATRGRRVDRARLRLEAPPPLESRSRIPA